MTSHLRRMAAAATAFLVVCADAAPAPRDSAPLRRDSAGIEIVEASRPLWYDSTSGRWRVDPIPMVDLAASGEGANHEFHRVRGMTRLSTGGLVVADGGSSEIRLFSEVGALLGVAGGEGEGPGEFTGLVGLARGRGDTLLALDWDDRVALFAPDLVFAGYFALPLFSQTVHGLDDGTVVVESETLADDIYEGGGFVRVPGVLWRVVRANATTESIGVTAGEEQHVVVSGPRQGQTGTLFGRRSHIATHARSIYYGRAVAMEVEELSAAGDPLRILRIPGFPLALSDGGIAPETATRQLRQRSAHAHAVPLGERSRHRQHIVIDRYRGPHRSTIA